MKDFWSMEDLADEKPDEIRKQGLTAHYLKMSRYKEQLFEALHNNCGMKGILNIAYNIVGNPLTVCDTSFSILENCPKHSNERDFVIRNGKQYMRPEAVASMHQEGLVDKILASPVPFVLYREALHVDIMYYRILIQKSVVGYLCILAQNHSFEKDDFEVARITAQMLSVEMQKSSFFIEKSGFKYEYFMADLIEGGMPDTAFIKQRMIQLGRSPLKYYWVMAAAFDDGEAVHINAQYYTEQLVTIVKNSMAFFYHGSIVLVTSAKGRKPLDEEELLKLKDFLRINRIRLVISHACTELLEIPLYYRQAELMLKLLEQQNFGQRILAYEDYVLECVVALSLSPAEQKAMIHPDIAWLKAYDEENHTEYLKTLKTYLEKNRNALQSGAALHIHKSTFFYRMGKICDMLGLDMNDCRRLFEYEASFKVLRLWEKDEQKGG